MYEQGHPDAASKEVAIPVPEMAAVTYQDGSQDIFARFSIYLCLHPDKAGNSEVYNIGDSANSQSLNDRWPYMCSLFGLVGLVPTDMKEEPTHPVAFLDHADMVERLRDEKGVVLQDVLLGAHARSWGKGASLTKSRDMCLNKAKAVGFKEETTMQESWKTVLGRYGKSKKAYFDRN